MDPAVLGVIATLIVAALGIVTKMIWSGFRDQIVKAVLESSLGKIFDGLKESIQHISEDVNHIKTNSDMARAEHRQTVEEVNALRRRFDSHLDVATAQDVDYKDFKHTVEDHIKRVRDFMAGHTHEALLTPPTKPEE